MQAHDIQRWSHQKAVTVECCALLAAMLCRGRCNYQFSSSILGTSEMCKAESKRCTGSQVLQRGQGWEPLFPPVLLYLATAMWCLFFLSNFLKSTKLEDDRGLQAEAASCQNLLENCSPKQWQVCRRLKACDFLPGLSPCEPHVQVIEHGRCLVADSYPVLVY